MVILSKSINQNLLRSLSITSIFLFFLIILIMSYLRSANFNFNFFDQGVFLVKLKNIQNNLHNEIFSGHFELYLYLFKYLNFNVEIYNLTLILISFVSVFSIIFYLFKIKRYEALFIYMLLPNIWFIFAFGYHSDILVIPIIFFGLESFFKKKYIESCLLISILFFIKEIYILNAACIFLFFYLNSRKKYFLILSLIFSILFFLIILFIINSKNSTIFDYISPDADN